MLTENLDVAGFAAFTRKVPPDHQFWFEALLRKVAVETPALLQKHLERMFLMSEAVRTIFTRNGFIPLYGAYRKDLREISIGPVIAFTYKNEKGDTVPSDILFEVFTKHRVLTTPMDEGIRINSRGISEAGKDLLRQKIALIIKELG